MATISISALTALLVCLFLTPLVRNVFLRVGLLDHPDVGRKSHKSATPRVGGIAVALSYVVAAFATLIISHVRAGSGVDQHLLLVWKLLPAAAVVFITGLLDDLVSLKPVYKLSGQFIAAALACWTGLRIISIAGHPVNNWIGVTVTVVWLLGCTNAFNWTGWRPGWDFLLRSRH
jgi:UDP-GlcNAc:undecaprenyl-phosphate GlcNAc-1-phosphate transferase